MSVYLISSREMGLVKIGRATDVSRRFQALQTGCPKPLILECQFDGGKAEEKDLHARFAEHRERGEWFRICPEIETFIAEHQPKPKYKGFQQGELVGPFRFDPEGWLALYQGTDEPMLKGVSDWMKYQAGELV